MTDFFNPDMPFSPFIGPDGLSKDRPLDASEVLQAALEQMDDIIASTQELAVESSNNNPHNSKNEKYTLVQRKDTITTINKNLDELKQYINDINDNLTKVELNTPCAKFVLNWLEKQLCVSSNDTQISLHSEDINSLQKLQELESDKKNLILQASVLADQVEAQADKINELERLLSQKKDDLIQLEHNLHQEVLARSSVENSKLELITELSNLRLRLTAAERDRKESDDKCRKQESEIIATKSRLVELETEYAILKSRLSRNASHLLPYDDNGDFKKYKFLVDSNSNDEKEHKLDDLRSSLTKYKKLQDIVLSGHGRKVADSSSHENLGLNSDSVLCSISHDSFKKHSGDINQVTVSRYSTLPSTSSIPKQFNQSVSSHNTNLINSSISPATTVFHKSNSTENMCSTILPSCNQHESLLKTNAQTLQQTQSLSKDINVNESPSQTREKEKIDLQENDLSFKSSSISRKSGGSKSSAVVSFGKGFFKLKSGKRSSSEPYLGDGFGVKFKLAACFHNACCSPA